MAVLKKIKFGTDNATPIAQTVVTAASESVLSVVGTNTELDDDANPSYAVDLNIDNATLTKDASGQQAVLKVGTVPAAQVSVADSADKFTAANVEAALSELKDDIASTGGAAKTYKIVEVASTDAASTSLKEYKVQVAVGSGAFADDTASATIVVPKDQHLKNVEIVNQDGSGNTGTFVKYTYTLADGNDSYIYLDVSSFLQEAEFGNGLKVTNGVVSVNAGNGLGFDSSDPKKVQVVIDPTSETFLTVGANGVKLAGVQDAIDAKVAALDKTDDAAVAGQYVAAIEETDGVVAVKTRANVSDAVLTGYTKGNAPAAGSEAVAATDDVKGAIAKLEHQVDAAKSAASAAHSVVAQGSGNTHVTVTASQPDASTGAVTYTVGETNIADADDLAAEITRAQNAEGEIAGLVGLGGTEGLRTFTPTSNYGGSSANVAANLQALDTALNTLSTTVGGISYSVSGTELTFYGIPQHQAQQGG